MLNRFPGPGLIPSNPLFQPFQFDMSSSNQMPNYPFPGLFDFSRFKRPNFDDQPIDTRPNTEKTTESNAVSAKRTCNVASLIPPSFASELDNVHPKSTFGDVDEPHSSRKHTDIHMLNTSSTFSSKKSSTVTTTATTTTSTFEKREPFTSPIVVDDDDDFNGRQSMSMSPHDNPHADFLGHNEEVKRKKNKDKSSKEGKKDKKDKELKDGKVKKKKDKKDKLKNKLKHGEYSKSPKDKAQLKKEKREKKKERERAALAMESGGLGDRADWSRDVFDRDTSSMDFNADTSSMEANAIPKLTLKLGPSSLSPSSRTSRPSTPDFPAQQRKS